MNGSAAAHRGVAWLALALGMGRNGEEGAPNNCHNYEVTEQYCD